MTQQKLRPRGVIFDLGSTLIEYEAMPWPELAVIGIMEVRRALEGRQHQLPPPDEFVSLVNRYKTEYKESSTATLREWDMTSVMARLCSELQLLDHAQEHDRLFDAYYSPVAEKLYIYEDTKDVLARLRDAGLAIGLVSNTIFPERVHRDELNRFGINSYFDHLTFSSTFGWKKPDPRIFQVAASGLGLDPADCVYVGDRYLEDIVGPSLIGMPAILKNKSRIEYPDPLPLRTRVVESLSGLFDHLEIG